MRISPRTKKKGRMHQSEDLLVFNEEHAKSTSSKRIVIDNYIQRRI